MQENRPNPGHRAEIWTDLDRPRQGLTIPLPDDSGQFHHPEVRQTASVLIDKFV